jgi:flavin-dependent dehydrogenase
VRVAVVGAGPAGSLLAWRLARDGADVTVYDPSHPREKPCGGGVTARALDRLPTAPADDPLPGREVSDCRFESGEGEWVDVRLTRPMLVASRRDLDAWLLRRATAVGARHVAERVRAVEDDGRLRTAGGEAVFDTVVGADGATSLVRRTFLGPTPTERLMIAAGWFARGTTPALVRFAPGIAGYLWLFPRPDHVGVGICAPLGAVPTRHLLSRLEREAGRHFPALVDDEAGRYAATIPSPDTDETSIREIAGSRWALVGDAAALADPVTGEGIHHALRSAEILADTLRDTGSPEGYPERLLEDFGRDLLKAAAVRDRFFAPGFPGRMVRYAAWSPIIRRVLADLMLGEQGYLDLKRRLLRAGPRFLLEAGVKRLRGAAR